MTFDLNFVVLGLLVLVLWFLIWLWIRFKLVEKYFAPLKFTLTNEYVVDPALKKDFLKFTIYNATLNDARITSFGYIYRQKQIDYFSEYLAQKQIPNGQPMMVPARESLSFSLPLGSLVDMVQDINGGSYKMKRIAAFATSSFGQTTKIKTKRLYKHLKKALRTRLHLEKQRLARIAKENRRLRREKSKKARQMLSQKIQAWMKKTIARLPKLKKKRKP